MKLVTAAQMRELDRRTIDEAGIPGEVLMDRAGEGVADAVRRLAEVTGLVSPPILLIAGRGNNGGDAFAAARVLKRMGFNSEVWLAGSLNEVKGDALRHMSRAKEDDVPIRELPTKEDWEDARDYESGADILVDGILGTGSSGPARGPAVGAIQYINAHANDRFVVAIDIPSGLNSDTGEAEGAAVFADLTVTLGLPKRGLVEPSALDYVGTVEVVDIGIPGEYVEHIGSDGDEMEMIFVTDVRQMFKRRFRASHKGTYGHVLLVGGARGYAGAIAMACRAAVKSGVGLVTCVTPESVAPIVAGASLETMVKPGRETETGSLAVDSWMELRDQMDHFNAIMIGPGLTRHDQSLALVRQVIRDAQVPLVLDADALNVLEGQPHWIEKAECPVVMTPHPGELSRLFSEDVSKIQQDRCGVALATARFADATVVLKGAGTVVARDGKPISVNMTGNPGMATGGTGDVLSGLLAGLLAQQMDPFDAARAAVFIHGRAGDMVAWRKSQPGLCATDVIEEIPYVFRDISFR